MINKTKLLKRSTDFKTLIIFYSLINVHNVNDRLLYQIIDNVHCKVSREYAPRLQEDNNHSSLLISTELSFKNETIITRNRDTKSFNFKKTKKFLKII